MLTAQERQTYIETLAAFPDVLEKRIAGLNDEQLHTAYLPGEWTVAQNVHHLADSHMNAFIRLKFILTQDNPTLLGYNQDAWAVTADYTPPIEHSLAILRGLHYRWAALLRSLTEDQWARSGSHTEVGRMTPEDLLRTYHNHCHAHIDQITRTLAAGGITV